jgi:putative ABC transport system substrate-binding protein
MWRKLGCGLLLQVLLSVTAGLVAGDCAQAAPPTIAVILPKTPAHLATIHQAFLKKFAELTTNWPPSHFYLQTPHDDYLSLRNSARKAVALNADLILAFGTSAALAAKAETFETPVVFADAIEPELIGLVTHDKRDSQLATGVRGNAPLQTLFKLLRELTNIKKLAVVLDGDPTDKQLTAIFKDVAGRRGLELVSINMREKKPADVLHAVVSSGADGMLFVEDEEKHLAVLKLALEQKIPVASIVPEMADQGALLVMEVSSEEQGEELAYITAAVLNGEYPEAIPVVTPHHTGIVINLNSAQQCGLQVPFEILSQATRVIR